MIKAQQSRSQERNRELALEKLKLLIKSVATVRKKRIPTRASKASKARRMDNKSRHGRKKELRKKVIE